MDKEIRFKCSDDMLAAVQVAAERKGLTAGAYVRMVVMDELYRSSLQIEKPRQG